VPVTQPSSPPETPIVNPKPQTNLFGEPSIPPKPCPWEYGTFDHRLPCRWCGVNDALLFHGHSTPGLCGECLCKVVQECEETWAERDAWAEREIAAEAGR
jgi:hypothetical protein